ncbi:glycosyltransferase [Candidatus Bathyarchaeota archaeon]|nr:glycosyltransferase [Candidatus Bathyarchaeota archaeon]
MLENYFEVVLIRSNPVLYEMRVLKIIRSLSRKYRLLVLGWDREGTHSSFEILEKLAPVKRFKMKAPYSKFHILLYYPLFWLWTFKNLLTYKPKIIHACDLDALVPGYFFKTLFSVKLVFDNFDRFAMAFIPPKYRLIYLAVNKIEDILAKNSDALIVVSDERKSSFGGYLPKYTEVIMNCPDFEGLEKTEDKPILEVDEPGVLTLVYAGAIAHDRGLILIGEAIKDLRDVRLILAGRVFDYTLIHLLKNSNVRYVGLLEATEVINLERIADVIPVLYDPSIPINRVASPNKLFEAMMLGVPVITNVCRDVVAEAHCGLIVDYDVEEVRNAIIRLKNDPSLRRKLGENGRRAFEQKYNWNLMEKRLLRLYDHILKANIS